MLNSCLCQIVPLYMPEKLALFADTVSAQFGRRLGRASLGPKTQLVQNHSWSFFRTNSAVDQVCFWTKCAQAQL